MCVQNSGNYQTEQVRYHLLNKLLNTTNEPVYTNRRIMYTSFTKSLESLKILPGLVAVGGYHSGTLPVNICHNG